MLLSAQLISANSLCHHPTLWQNKCGGLYSKLGGVQCSIPLPPYLLLPVPRLDFGSPSDITSKEHQHNALQDNAASELTCLPCVLFH